MTAESVKRQPLDSQQVRIAAIVVVAVVVGVVLWLVLGRSGKHHGKVFHAVGPIVYSAKNLAAESKFINTRFFWAGKQPIKGAVRYEFTRLTNGHLYVRYLTKGAKIGNTDAKYLVISTYPDYPTAYKTVKASANAQAGPGNSVILVRPHTKGHNILMAFKGIPDQIEIYDPSASKALAIALSGDIKPVRS